jgi:hypothetical protein
MATLLPEDDDRRTGISDLIDESCLPGYYTDDARPDHIGIAKSQGLWDAVLCWYRWTTDYGYQLASLARDSQGATFHTVVDLA